MNNGLLLKLDFFDKVSTIVDIIPKLIYFLLTAFMSAIDALQNMVRKLAGLDMYYVVEAGSNNLTEVAQTDPLTEFVMGILGMGDSAPLYRGLNTVFWSLAIFGVVALALTTMVAIIKSHYNEDTAGTSPWKYVYTAIKAIFTFAIVPFTVIIGMELATWTLSTLDSITAGSATAEDLEYYFGPNATQMFEGGRIKGTTVYEYDENGEILVDEETGEYVIDEEASGTRYYSNYDFFGAGSPTSSTTFSGMLFKAAGYNANRARDSWAYCEQALKIQTDGSGALLGQSTEYQALQNNEQRAAFIADSIDYMFANNLKLSNYMHGMHIRSVLGEDGTVRYWSVTDFINGLLTNFKHFSKWNVGAVWFFYNLWSYNFIIGFGCGVTIVGLMLSVIVGLMSRLIKGAVLFLIYPALLGIAPLDNFKAFKSWVSQFMQQIMMAFGGILGMNLTLLILPYVQNIRFFGIGVVDAIVNTIILIVGLMMMKDIMTMISSFAGGADAAGTGGGLKGEVGKALGRGVKTSAVLGMKATKGVVKGTVGTGKAIHGAYQKHKLMKGARDQQKFLDKKATLANWDSPENKSKRDAAVEEAGRLAEAKAHRMYDGKMSKPQLDATVKRMREDAENKQRAKFDEQRTRLESDTQEGGEGRKKFDERQDKYAKYVEKYEKRTGHKVFGGEDITLTEEKAEAKAKRKAEIEASGGRLKWAARGISTAIWGQKTKKDENGEVVPVLDENGLPKLNVPDFGAAFQKVFGPASMKEAAKEFADGFLKSVGDISSQVGLDKIVKGMGDIFEKGLTVKGGIYAGAKGPEGDKLTQQLHAEADAKQLARHNEEMAAAKKSEDLQTQMLAALKSLQTGINGVATGVTELGNKFTASTKGTGSGGTTTP